MRVVELRSYGIDGLALKTRAPPVPKANEVLVKMSAVSLNQRDLMVVTGIDRWRPPLPRVPLSDGVGVVIDVGSDVSRVRVGARVAPIFYPMWIEGPVASHKLERALGGAEADGVLAEFVVVDEHSLVVVPDELSDAEAATLPCAAVTAWHAVVECGRVLPGHTVVVPGTGGVSMFALQFARMLGARVIVTSSSASKLRRARELGAHAAINYSATPDWPEMVRRMTDAHGADHVVDTVGSLDDAVSAVRVGGAIAFVGLLHGLRAEVNLVKLMGKSASIHAVDVGSREMFESMLHAVQSHALRPVIDRIFAVTDFADAFSYLSRARHVGKVCLVW